MRPGEVIADRFRLVRYIARGGMGEVYEAEDLALGLPVALKIVRKDMATDHLARERFKREAQLARQVTHRNVCRLYDVFSHREVDDFGVTHELVGLSMELLAGETLDRLLARVGPLTPEQALPLVEQMVAALAAAHDAGVVHRDFKSANVMVVPEDGSERERVVVTDFGLARSMLSAGEPLTAEDMAVGTVDYMAPEQAEGRMGGVPADIYGLGVVLFEMVTGRRPHVGATPLALMLDRVRSPPPSPRALCGGLDRSWERAILRCLEVDPRDRFQQVCDVLPALAGESVGRGPAAIGAALWRRARSEWRRRWWLLPALVLAALAAGGLVAAVVLERSRVQSPPPGPPDPVQLTTWDALEVDPSFSPDGRRVALSSNRDGSFEIYLLSMLDEHPPIKLTDDGEDNFQPTFSPDGHLLAYASHGRGGIWLIDVAGGSPRQLTDFGSHPAWSADGRRMVFQSDATAELSANAAAAAAPSTIWLVDLEDGALTQLTRAGDPTGGHGSPRWSPDGSRVVFSASARTWSRIFSVPLAGGAPTALVTEVPAAFDPLPGPGGRHLYYSAISEGERYGVWRIPVDWATGQRSGPPQLVSSMGGASIRRFSIAPGSARMVHTALGTSSNLWSLPLDPVTAEVIGDAVALSSGSGRSSRPAVSFDGEWVAFDRWWVGANQDIWMVRIDGSELVQVTRHPSKDSQASWFPDGRRVSFLSDRDGGLSLWSAAVDGATQGMLARLGPEVDWVRLSPDGTHIAFHWTGRDRATNIWVARMDGSEPRQITFDREAMAYPCWSPDGSMLAFEMKRDSDDHLMVMPAAGGTPLQLTDEAGKSWPYSWSPDGDKILFAGLRSGRWNLFWVSRGSAEVRQLTHWDRPDAYVRYPAWSPQGDRIVFELARTTGDLWLLDGID